jgi:hypothetical protein
VCFDDLEKLSDLVWLRFAFHVLQIEYLGYLVVDKDVMAAVDSIKPISERFSTGNCIGEADVFRTRQKSLQELSFLAHSQPGSAQPGSKKLNPHCRDRARAPASGAFEA